MARAKCVVVASLVAICSAAIPRGMAFPAESPYFPETGRGAVHQRALDLTSGGVVLMVTLQPGYEDLSLLADLRLVRGVRTVVVYFTNGDATPSDRGTPAPVFTAAMRKEESVRAITLLDGTPYYLNIPDPGIVPSREILNLIWNPDTAVARIERVLRHFRPDAVIVGGDSRGDTVQSARQRVLAEYTLRAVRVAGDPAARPDTVKPGAWKVPRVFVESAWDSGRKETKFDAAHPVWKKSIRSIGQEAADSYESLNLQMSRWNRNGDRSYSRVYPAGGSKTKDILDGLPVVSPRLRSLASSLKTMASRSNRGIRSPRLSDANRMIDSLDRLLARNRNAIAPNDLRLLASWKNGLEKLRCSLLDVNVDFSASDSLVTNTQIFYLRIKDVSSRGAGMRDRIVFPAALDHTWGVNESLEAQFPLKAPEEFRILTPRQLDFVLPISQFGITQSTLRTRFSFLIMHQDSVRDHNFIYRQEVLLQPGPRRTFEILTPVIRALDGEPIIYRMLNISRDPYRGTFALSDSLAYPVSRAVFLPEKDFQLTDTLRLSLRHELPPGDTPIHLGLSGGGEMTVTARRFDVATPAGVSVGVLSAIPQSPVQTALDRIRVQWTRIGNDLSDLGKFSAILIDRDATAATPALFAQGSSLLAWVRSGGHLVVLSQSSTPNPAALLPGGMFSLAPQLPPTTPVRIDSTTLLALRPNALARADWDGWVVARSLCSVRPSADRKAVVLVRSSPDNIPLVVDLPEGKGRMTLVALDLESQLQNVHPGAHRFLANLLSP